MDWFLYDIGLCHERVKELPYTLFCAMIFFILSLTGFCLKLHPNLYLADTIGGRKLCLSFGESNIKVSIMLCGSEKKNCRLNRGVYFLECPLIRSLTVIIWCALSSAERSSIFQYVLSCIIHLFCVHLRIGIASI